MVSWRMVAGLLGGVGLFLLGMRMMTDGLRLAAGTALRDILGRWTRSTLRGVFSGALVTGLVQSSSAVTVATIGFVNAGVLTLAQGVGVIYGSNIGTTMTGWLVALIGLEFDIKTFSLPLIGLGMLVRLVRGEGRFGHLAEALAGFGVLFLGIEVLKTSFGGLGAAFDMKSIGTGGVTGVLLFTGVGVLLTFLMQSSSAAIAVTLTAVASGAVGPLGGAALVIGANLGTTTTAALAAIGATANAKRVAGAHVMFNLLTGVVALLTLPLLLGALARARGLLGFDANPPAVLALFHTTFNLMGVLLMIPLTGRLVRFLEQRFRTQEEMASSPRHLDATVLHLPYLALRALALEMQRVARLVREMATESIQGVISLKRLQTSRAVIDTLLDAIGRFGRRMRERRLPEPVAAALPAVLRAAGYLAEIARVTASFERREVQDVVRNLGLESEYGEYLERVVAVLHEGLGSSLEPGGPEPVRRKVRKRYEAMKVVALRRASERDLDTRAVLRFLDHLQQLRRIASRARKCAHYLAPLLSLDEEPAAPPLDEGEDA